MPTVPKGQCVSIIIASHFHLVPTVRERGRHHEHSRDSPLPCVPSPRRSQCYQDAWQQCSQLPSRAGSFAVCNSTHVCGSRLCRENQLSGKENLRISETVQQHPLLLGCVQRSNEINPDVYKLAVSRGWDFYSLRLFFPPGLVLCTGGAGTSSP